jgi:hypothetical protein
MQRVPCLQFIGSVRSPAGGGTGFHPVRGTVNLRNSALSRGHLALESRAEPAPSEVEGTPATQPPCGRSCATETLFFLLPASLPCSRACGSLISPAVSEPSNKPVILPFSATNAMPLSRSPLAGSRPHCQAFHERGRGHRAPDRGPSLRPAGPTPCGQMPLRARYKRSHIGFVLRVSLPRRARPHTLTAFAHMPQFLQVWLCLTPTTKVAEAGFDPHFWADIAAWLV